MSKNTYQLFIQIGEGGKDSSPISKDGENTSKKDDSLETGLTAYAVAKPFISFSERVIASNATVQYANAEIEQRIGLGMQVANYGIKAGMNMLAGKSLATSLGLGGGAGAMAGLAITAVSTVLEIVGNQIEINNKAKIENEQLQILRTRAGIQYNRSRSGE